MSNSKNLSSFVKSIYELGIETNLLDQYVKASKKLLEISNEIPIISFLSDQTVPILKKEELIKESFSSKNLLYFRNWILILIKYKVVKQLNRILMKFINLYNDENKIAEGIIWTTYPLEKQKLAKIKSIFEKKLSKKIFLVNKIDSSLISGIKLEIGNNFWENNVLNSLNTMVNELLTN